MSSLQVAANNEICEEVEQAGGVTLALRILMAGARRSSLHACVQYCSHSLAEKLLQVLAHVIKLLHCIFMRHSVACSVCSVVLRIVGACQVNCGAVMHHHHVSPCAPPLFPCSILLMLC